MLEPNTVQRGTDRRSPLPHQNEFPAEYSLAGCSPAEPASAFPAILILTLMLPVCQNFSANGNCPLVELSHYCPQSTGVSPMSRLLCW
jgi:hypothetical protein